MSEALLYRAPGPWPFLGAFAGRAGHLAFAGRVSGSLAIAHGRAREVELALARIEPGERRQVLTRAWEALRALDVDGLSVLLVSRDAAGVGISGVGLRSLWAAGQGPPRTYLPSDHPLFGPPGLSEQRPGALTVAQAPPALVGTVEPCDALPDGLDVLRRDCGVWP